MLVHLVKKFLLGADFGLVAGEGAGGLLLIVLGLGNWREGYSVRSTL